MTKAYKQASSFLSKLADNQKQAMETKSEPANALRSMFGIQTLDPKESSEIEEILLENATASETQPAQFRQDIEELKAITAEIRSIQKQSALLLGERVYKAREILKKYRNGSTTFTQWVTSTFSSRRTAYNCLSYYELYCALPGEKLKSQLQKMSHKAVYILASRTGSWEKKIHIVEKFFHLQQEEIIPLIRKTFPLEKITKRPQRAPRIDQPVLALTAILKKKGSLNASERKQLVALRALINIILK